MASILFLPSISNPPPPKKRGDPLSDNILASVVTDGKEDADEPTQIKVMDGMLSGYFRTARVCRDRRDYGDAQLLGGPKPADWHTSLMFVKALPMECR